MASTTYRVHFESPDCPPLLCVVPANTSISDYLDQNRPNLPADISSGYLHVVVQDKPSASDADTKSEEAEVINVFVAKNIWRAHELWKEAMLSQLLRRLTRLEHDYKDIKEGGQDLNSQISSLKASQDLNDLYFESWLAHQQVLLQFETLSRILRILNDKILRNIRESTGKVDFKHPQHINYIDKILVCARGNLPRQYSNTQFQAEAMQLVKDTVNLVPGTWPLGTLAETDKTDDIRKSDSPQLYAKKALKFLSDQELRLALQLFAILNSPQNSGRNKIAHLRPSTTHAAKCITLLSAAMAGFETACALQIVSENEPFLDHTIPFGQVEADEGMQHTLANRVEGARRLKHSREGVGAGDPEE